MNAGRDRNQIENQLNSTSWRPFTTIALTNIFGALLGGLAVGAGALSIAAIVLHNAQRYHGQTVVV